MATEVALLPLRAGLDEDFDLTTSEAYQDTIRTLKEQHGFQRLYWGTEKQDPNMLRFFVDWDSVEDHIAFTKTKRYSAFMDRFGEVVDMSRGQLYHMHATPHPPLVLSSRVSPVTEIWSIFFPVDYSEDAQYQFNEDVKKLFTMVGKQPICKGSSGGWVVEDINTPDVTNKVKAFQAFMGWESLRTAREFQQTSTFKEAATPIENARYLVRITKAHYTGTLEDSNI